MSRRRKIQSLKVVLGLVGFIFGFALTRHVNAELTGSLSDVIITVKFGSDGLSSISFATGKGTVKNEKGETVFDGEIRAKEGWIGLNGKKGTSFEYAAQAERVDYDGKCDRHNRTGYAVLLLDRQNRWMLGDEAFYFLLGVSTGIRMYNAEKTDIIGSVDITKGINAYLPESIARASEIRVPAGELRLFGYSIRARRDGARVRFRCGDVVDCVNCTASVLK